MGNPNPNPNPNPKPDPSPNPSRSQVRKEAAYALCNACGCNDATVLAGLVHQG